MTDIIKKIEMQHRVNQIREVSRTSPVTGVGEAGSVAQGAAARAENVAPGVDFKTILDEQLAKNSPLQFSKHARERVVKRGIELTDELLGNLHSAVSKARDKGARDVVIIDAGRAFIVNIPNNVVVTTVTDKEMKDSVFTNIDSAVII